MAQYFEVHPENPQARLLKQAVALLAKGGLPRQAVTPEEMKAIEPTLAGNYYGGYFT